MTYAPDRQAARLLPDLSAYPPQRYRVVYHPDVQLTPDEWLELKDYEKVESATAVAPGTVAVQRYELVAQIPLRTGRLPGIA